MFFFTVLLILFSTKHIRHDEMNNPHSFIKFDIFVWTAGTQGPEITGEKIIVEAK